MSELLKKYESLDQSKLNEGTIKILNRVKTITADFTADDAKNNKIAEDVLNEVMKKNPNAVKIVKRTPKAKTATKKTHKATHTTKGAHTTSSTPKSSNNIMSVAKEIQKSGESWKDAMERAKVVLKERKEQVVQKQKTELEKLYNLVKTKKELQGFTKSDIQRDAKRDAKPRGARVVTKQGSTSNKYGTFPNKLGRKYWETRDRHADRLAPNYPKGMPLLASGGAVSDAPFSVEVFKTKLRFDNELTSSSKGDLPTFAKAKEFAIDMIDNGNYYAYIISKNGYLWGVDSKGVEQFADGGMMDNMSIHNSTDFFNTPVYAKGGGLDRDTHEKEVKFLKSKKFTDIKTTDYDSTVKFGNINNDEVIFASVGKKDDGYGKTGYGIAYFFQNEDNGVSSISREILDEIASTYNGSKVELFTNAGVDLHSTNRNMYKNILVRRVPYDNFDSYANGGSINMDKHIWEGWTVGDFIEELEPTFNQIMSGGSWQKPFKTKDEVKAWCMDNQPYYKKNIPDVVNYFWAKAQSKDNYANGGTMWTKEKVENEISHWKNLLRNIDKYPNYNKKNVEKIIAEYEEKLAKNEFADGGGIDGGMNNLTIQNVTFENGGGIKDLPSNSVSKTVKYWASYIVTTETEDSDKINSLASIMDELKLYSNMFFEDGFACLGFNFKGTKQQLKDKLVELSIAMKKMKVGGRLDLLNETSKDSYDSLSDGQDDSFAKGGSVKKVPAYVKRRLEELREEIREERISYGEIAELESLKKYIDPSDVELLQWAGVEEFPDDSGHYAKGGGFALYKIQMKSKYDIQPKWEDEKFQTGGRKFLTFKQAQDFKKKLQGLSSSIEYKVLKVGEDEKLADGGSLPFMTDPNFGNFQNTGAFEAGGMNKFVVHFVPEEAYRSKGQINEDAKDLNKELEKSGMDFALRFYDSLRSDPSNTSLMYGEIHLTNKPDYDKVLKLLTLFYFQPKKSFAKGGSVKKVPAYVKKRLEELRKEIRAERISYEELAELQSLAQYIEPNDVELLEPAGVPEFEEEEEEEFVDFSQYDTIAYNLSEEDAVKLADEQSEKNPNSQIVLAFTGNGFNVYVKKDSYELGGAFMMTDLAGHTGGSDGLGNQTPLSGVSGTYYTGLVGETGAMSSGELFMNGGAMAQNQQVINDASQSYVNYYLGEGASQGIYKDGGSIPNNYEGRTPEDVWNNWTVSQKEHFVSDHFEVFSLTIPEFSDWFEKYGEFAKNNASYDSLPPRLKSFLKDHISEGQYASGGSLGEELMGGQSNATLKPSGYHLVSAKGREIIVSDDGGNSKERWVKNNGFSGYRLVYKGNDYEFTDSFEGGGMFDPNVSDGTQFMSGVYAYGGKTKSTPSMRKLYVEQIAFATNTRAVGVDAFAKEHNLTDSELSNLMTGIGRKMISQSDFVTALVGEKGNAKQKEVIAFAKSDKAYKMANGGALKFKVGQGEKYFDKKEKMQLTIGKESKIPNVYNVNWEDGENSIYSADNINFFISKGIWKKLDKMADGGDVLPPSKTYGENIYKAMQKFNISDSEARKKYGQYTISEWENLLSEKMTDGGGIRSQEELNKIISEKDEKVKGLTPKQVAEMWNENSFAVKEGISKPITVEEAKNPTMRMYLRNLLIENELTEDEYNEYFAKGGTLKKYIDNEDINYVALMIKGSRRIVKGSDVLNGANLLKDGGDLSNIAFYVPKRDVISVTLKNGKTIKPVNGYWVKKDYQPISGSGGNNVDESFKIGDYVKKTEKQGSIVYGTQGFIYEINKDFSEIKLEDDYGNKNPKSFKLKGFRKLKSKSKNANVSSNASTSIVKKDSNKLIAPKGYVFVNSGSHRATQQINRGDAKYVSLYSFGGANTSAGTTIMFMTEKDFEKVKDIRGVSPAKNYLPAKSQWFSRHEDKKLDDVFLGIEQKESFGYADGGEMESTDITADLEKFNIDNLDYYEYEQYNHFLPRLGKAQSLQLLINTVDGDTSQLSPELAELAEKQGSSYADGGSVSEDISECKKLVSAFCKEFGDKFGLDEEAILEKVKFQDYLGHGASVFISLSITSNVTDLKVGETRPTTGYIILGSDINPNGVTGKDDISRTYDIDIEIKGIKRYTQRRTDEGRYFKSYSYGRTIEEAMDKTDTKILYDLYPLEKKDDLKFKMSHLFANGGGFANDPFYKAFMEKRDKLYAQLKSRVVRAVGIDEAIEFFDYEHSSIAPYRFLERAVQSNLIALDEINKELVDSAIEESREIDNDEDLEEIGSSDFTYYLKSVLDNAGFKVGFVNDRLQRLNEDGSVKEIENNFADGGFMNNVYADGGELQGKFLAEIKVPYNYESVVKDEFEFTEFLSKALTKKWFGNGVWGVKIVKSLFGENYGQKIVVEIEIPVGVTQGGGLDKFDVGEFISKTLTKKWFGNGIWGVDVVKSFADGGMFEDNDGFMRADNNNNYRYPEMEVYVETLDEPIDLTSNVSGRSNKVVIKPLDENIDLNDDNRVRATMGYNPKNRNPENFSKINPRAFEFIDLPMPTSNTHKND